MQPNDIPLNEISDIISESYKDITSILKAAGSPKRLKILSFLLKGPKSFSFILDHLKIKRTTINHHLDLLMESKLIEKENFGVYRLTESGIEFIVNIVNAYQIINNSSQKNQEKLIKEYVNWPDFIKEPRIINEKKFNNPPLYEGGWNSYISSITGVLNFLGVPYDYYYISGVSGFCFLTCLPSIIKTSLIKEDLPQEAWKDIYNATESFGWKLKKWEKVRENPGKWNLTGEDIDLSLKVFNQVKSVIDSLNTPVLLYGIHHTGYGIVNGYRNDSYLVSSFLRHEGREEVSVRFDQLRVIDKFIYIYFDEKIKPLSVESMEKQSLKRAIRFSKSENYSKRGYYTGPKAWDYWITSLMGESTDKIDRFGNSISGIYYFDQKEISQEYLDRLSRKYKNTPQGSSLKEASKSYRNAKMEMEKFTVLFPYFEPENSILRPEKRKKGIEILKNVKKYELEAIESMEEAYRNWV
jgi:DNA-binding transcriptional ArsR family regulator